MAKKILNLEQLQDRADKVLGAWSNRATMKDAYTLLLDLDLRSVHGVLYWIGNIKGWEAQADIAMYYIERTANQSKALR